VSQYPRRVLTGVWVPDGVWNHPGAAPVLIWVRAGTVVDVVPGSALEQLYGGAGNLSPVIPVMDPKRSPDGGADTLSKAALGN